MEYSIFIRAKGLTASDVTTKLEAIQSTADRLTKTLLDGYIWQREAFTLQKVRHDGIAYLYGKTAFGDSIEDEWVIVYILRELSLQHEETWIKVVDTDGELLLIEAAHVLPRWLTPENADNRVWINRGQLTVVPVPLEASGKSAQPKPSPNLSLRDALRLVEAGKIHRDRRMDEEAFHRLREYPGKTAANHHHALLKIPRKLACVLVEDPRLVSPAIEAFYLRDPIALRPLHAPDHQRLLFPPSDLVTLRVKFAKVGFAQLRSQQFRTPGAWSRALQTVDAQSKGQVEMGMKLSSGFEMLALDPQNKDQPAVARIKAIAEAVDKGEKGLPSDTEILAMGAAADDESWLDINFEDLASELDGTSKDPHPNGFGDPLVQENLRRMASRLETILNDDSAGDDEDGNESDRSSGSGENDPGSDGEAKEGSFDEDEFTAMMREMMGMPRETMKELMGPAGLGPRAGGEASDGKQASKQAEETTLDELTARMEGELREAGAPRLEEKP